MRHTVQFCPLRTIFSLALFITAPTTALSTTPDTASNLVLQDVPRVDPVVPSESIAIDYDKTSTLNVPPTPVVHSISRAALNSNASSTPEVHSTSSATLSSDAFSTPEVQSNSRDALSLNVPLTPEVHSTPNVALSSHAEVLSTPKAAEPSPLQEHTESKDALSSSLPSTLSTNEAVPVVPSQVQPESKAALNSDPEALTTLQVQSNSNAALSLDPFPTTSTHAALSSLPEASSTFQVHPESNPAPEVPPTLQVQSESKTSLNPTPEVLSTLQVQSESIDALNPAPGVLPTSQVQAESNDALNPAPEVPPTVQAESKDALSLSLPATEASKLQPESRAGLISDSEVSPQPHLHLPLTEIQSQLQALSSHVPSEVTKLAEVEAAVSLPPAPSLPKVVTPSSILSRARGSPKSSPSTPSLSKTLSSVPRQLQRTVNNTASHLVRSASARPLSASTPSLFNEADSITQFRVQRTTPRTFTRQAAAGGYCRGDGRCVPLSYCRLLADLLDRSCLIGDRLQELTCGYGNREPLVCCPPGGFTSIYPSGPPPTNPPPTQPPPPPPPPTPLPSKCGIPQVFNWRADYRGLGSQPWVARVGFKSVESGAMQYPCCGSIISSRVILTAAHCALAKTVGHKLSAVRVGEFDASQDPDCTAAFCAHKVQDVAVSHVVVHPGYERSTFINDIALLVLRQPLNFTLSTQPICLDGGNYTPMPNGQYVGSRAKLVGWGMTAGQTDVPELQQQLDLPVIPLDQCARLYDEVVPITTQHLCVGGEPGRDACSGFGGAPLLMLDSSTHTRFYQIGMVSFGSKQCGAPGVPSVYTRIDKYFDWIRANMNY